MKTLTVIAMLLGLAATAVRTTIIDQPALETQTWTEAGSPYEIWVPVEVLEGHVLTIEPGVVVRLLGDSGLFLAEGASLVAEGIEQERILFTSDSGPFYVGGIFLAVPGGSSRISDCIFEYVQASMPSRRSSWSGRPFASARVVSGWRAAISAPSTI